MEIAAPAQPARERGGRKRGDKHKKVDPGELRVRLEGAQKTLQARNGGDTSDCTPYCSTQRAGESREGREGRRVGAKRDAGKRYRREPEGAAARLLAHSLDAQPTPPSYDPSQEEERGRGRERERDRRRKAMEARRDVRLAGLALTW